MGSKAWLNKAAADPCILSMAIVILWCMRSCRVLIYRSAVYMLCNSIVLLQSCYVNKALSYEQEGLCENCIDIKLLPLSISHFLIITLAFSSFTVGLGIFSCIHSYVCFTSI